MNVPLLFTLTWLFPGLGHTVLKSYRRAGAYAFLILVSLILGMILQGRVFVPVKGDIVSYLASLANLGLGGLYFVIGLIFGYRGNPASPTSDYGTLFILSAGLMNLLLLIEVYDIHKGKRNAS